MISLKSCLIISLVSSSQTSMSSARIPLLSGDLLFLCLLIAFCNSSVVISNILLSSLVSCSKSSLVVLVKSFVEFSENVGHSFSRCDALSFVVLYFFDEYFLCCFDPRAMDLAHTCVKHPRRLYVCQGLASPKHQMRLYVCHQMRLHVCHQMRLPRPQRSSLRSLTFARFTRTFFNRLNNYFCPKSSLVQKLILV